MADRDPKTLTDQELRDRIASALAEQQVRSIRATVPVQVLAQLRDYAAAGGDPTEILATAAVEWQQTGAPHD